MRCTLRSYFRPEFCCCWDCTLAAGAKAARIDYAPTIVTSGDPADKRYATPRGAGYDGVAELLIESDIGSFGCTGVLLDGRYSLLTAAHCLTDEAGTRTPESARERCTFSWTLEPRRFRVRSFRIHPDWSGDVRRGNDLAIVTSRCLVSPLVQTYALFTGPGDLRADFAIAGFGAGGTGATRAHYAVRHAPTRRQYVRCDDDWHD